MYAYGAGADAGGAAADAGAAGLRRLGRAVSPGREVTAGVSASGLLTELVLTEKALEWDERALAKLIMETVNAAHRKLGEAAVALSAETFGEDSPVTARLQAEADARSVKPAEPGIGYV